MKIHPTLNPSPLQFIGFEVGDEELKIVNGFNEKSNLLSNVKRTLNEAKAWI